MENSQGSSLKNDVYGGRTQEEIYILLGLIMERDGVDITEMIKKIKEKEDMNTRYRQQQKVYTKKRKDDFNRIQQNTKFISKSQFFIYLQVNQVKPLLTKVKPS